MPTDSLFHRMGYADAKARGLPIGSGVVEAACKTLVTERLKLSGMRSGVRGGQATLTLRSLVQSRRFDPESTGLSGPLRPGPHEGRIGSFQVICMQSEANRAKITRVGSDLDKSAFHVHAVDRDGKVVTEKRFTRRALVRFPDGPEP